MNKIKTLQALDKLIKFYDSFEPEDAIPPRYDEYYTNEHCPLCALTCPACPWILINKKYCGDGKFHRQTIKERLTRLNRWKRKIENMK